MNRSSLNLQSDYILKKRLIMFFDLPKNRSSILELEFPIFKNNDGVVRINNIKLDAETSSRLTYQLCSLDFLITNLDDYKKQIQIFEIRKKTIRFFISTLMKLKSSKSLREIEFFLTEIENERKSVKRFLSKNFHAEIYKNKRF